MKNKIIKDIVKIVDKLDKEDQETLLTYVTGAECCIKNLADDVLHFMENNDIESKTDKQKYKDVEEDYNIAKENFEYVEQYKTEKSQKEKEAE